MDRVIFADISNSLGRLDTGGALEEELNCKCPGCAAFIWPFWMRMDDSHLHDDDLQMEVAS